MEYKNLGNTGIKVSVAGLGTGGSSKLGLGLGRSEADAIALVHAALDLGITLIDTAAAYGTEDVVGKALKATPRDRVVLVTKSFAELGPGRLLSADEVVASLDTSLRLLRTDHVDVFQLHRVPTSGYDHALHALVPALLKERDKGKFRFLGITEPPNDGVHATLQRALEDDVWRVMMLAFNMMHQSARRLLFPHTTRKGIGTLLIFVVRRLFSDPRYLKETIGSLVESGQLPQELANDPDPLGFLVHEGGASSLMDAAYRYGRHERGADLVLLGTANPAHLRENVASVLKPPLPAGDQQRLGTLFGHLVGVGMVDEKPTRPLRS